jgi:cyclic pyranopterin phosphate synthase
MAQESNKLTHLDEKGAAHMVDVADKPVTHRRAVASGFVQMQPSTLQMIAGGDAPKGDVFAAARIAGISASKRTSDLIPLCHPLTLTRVSVDLAPQWEPDGTDPVAHDTRTGVRITVTAETDGKTGVEMEALTAAAVAGLTIYDMCKAVDRGMIISDIALLSKEGGASGTWTRTDSGTSEEESE